MQPNDSTLPIDKIERALIAELLPEEIEQVTERLNEAVAKSKYLSLHPNAIRPTTVYFKDGRWLMDKLGSEPVDLHYIAIKFAREISATRLKAEKLAKQRTAILLLRANMNEDEFVDWAIQTIPLLCSAMVIG